MRLPQYFRFVLLAAALSVVVAIVVSVWAGGGAASTTEAVSAAVTPSVQTAALQQAGNPEVRTATHDQTGKLTFLGVDPASPIAVLVPPQEGLNAQDRGLAILTVYGEEFGLNDPAGELTAMKAAQSPGGRASVRYQQAYEGVPVLAGELIVNTDSAGRLLSISGEISPGLSLSTTPVLTAAEASSIALAGVAKWYGLDEAEIETSEPDLWIYDERLLRRSGRPQELVWRIDVSPTYVSAIKELVLVNAERGGVSLHFNQVDSALNRTIYDNNNTTAGLPGLGPVRMEGGPVHAVTDVNEAYDYAGDTYDFYMTTHGRDSLDNAGMGLISTVRHCEPAFACPYANAFWNGTQMAYGEGFTADDVVGHELTHGVTSFESNLFYYYQSGAISESFSDVWGEFVDLGNGAGTDTAGVRWLLGEDLPGGAIRNMSDPPALGDPDKMTSVNYWIVSGDNGGVHTNSGINNKAVYLMVDGGTFNGETVIAMGITKVAKVYYEVQTNLLASGADYGDLYHALFQGCLNLVGTSGISAADCQEVRDATDAVEMNLEPSPGFNPDAPMCPAGQTPITLFFDDIESGGGNWLGTAITGPNAWFLAAFYGHSGTTSLWAIGTMLASDSVVFMVSDVALPSAAYLWFAHAYDFEPPDWDGGFFEYSTDAGGSWSDAGSLIDSGKAYDGTISAGFDNTNAGHAAYLDTSHGYVSTRVDLSTLAGQNVRFRWRQSTDSSVGDLGWFVDDVTIYTCAVPPTPTPTPTITPTPTKQPKPGDTDGDGCSDQRENGPDQTQGGQRNYKDPNDYYDVYGSGQSLTHDGVIDLPNDILGVIQHFAPTGAPPYDLRFDRGPQTGANTWNMGPPDGVIDLPNDVLGVILQFGHNCV